jgi:hypothetical protein
MDSLDPDKVACFELTPKEILFGLLNLACTNYKQINVNYWQTTVSWMQSFINGRSQLWRLCILIEQIKVRHLGSLIVVVNIDTGFPHRAVVAERSKSTMFTQVLDRSIEGSNPVVYVYTTNERICVHYCAQFVRSGMYVYGDRKVVSLSAYDDRKVELVRIRSGFESDVS